jgi:hypothetical protein
MQQQAYVHHIHACVGNGDDLETLVALGGESATLSAEHKSVHAFVYHCERMLHKPPHALSVSLPVFHAGGAKTGTCCSAVMILLVHRASNDDRCQYLYVSV